MDYLIIFVIIFTFGFLVGGHWRHRLFKNQDRALMEDTIYYKDKTIKVLKNYIEFLEIELKK